MPSDRLPERADDDLRPGLRQLDEGATGQRSRDAHPHRALPQRRRRRATARRAARTFTSGAAGLCSITITPTASSGTVHIVASLDGPTSVTTDSADINVVSLTPNSFNATDNYSVVVAAPPVTMRHVPQIVTVFVQDTSTALATQDVPLSVMVAGTATVVAAGCPTNGSGEYVTLARRNLHLPGLPPTGPGCRDPDGPGAHTNTPVAPFIQAIAILPTSRRAWAVPTGTNDTAGVTTDSQQPEGHARRSDRPTPFRSSTSTRRTRLTRSRSTGRRFPGDDLRPLGHRGALLEPDHASRAARPPTRTSSATVTAKSRSRVTRPTCSTSTRTPARRLQRHALHGRQRPVDQATVSGVTQINLALGASTQRWPPSRTRSTRLHGHRDRREDDRPGERPVSTALPLLARTARRASTRSSACRLLRRRRASRSTTTLVDFTQVDADAAGRPRTDQHRS